MRNFSKFIVVSLTILLSSTFYSTVLGFEVPSFLLVGENVEIINHNEDMYYAVFLTLNAQSTAMNCSSMSGLELSEDNNLKNYGTCFINDPGVFTVVEIIEPYASSYEDLKQAKSIVQEKTITLLVPESAIISESSSSISESTSSSDGLDWVLGLRTKRYINYISENFLFIVAAWVSLVLSVILVYVLYKKHRNSRKKQ